MRNSVKRSRRFVIAIADRRVAGLLQRAMRRFFSRPNGREVAVIVVRAKEELRRLRSLAAGCDWLLIGEHLPTKTADRALVGCGGRGNGWEEAYKWVARKKSRRAIVLTDATSWYPDPPPITRRVMALPIASIGPGISALRDIVHAGEAALDYLPPTIAHVAVNRRGGKYYLSVERDAEGPLKDAFAAQLGDAIRGEQRLEMVFDADLAEQENLARDGNLLQVGRHLAKQVYQKEFLLWKVVHAADEAARSLAPQQGDAAASVYPIHLHVHWRGRQSFHLPLEAIYDLTRRSRNQD